MNGNDQRKQSLIDKLGNLAEIDLAKKKKLDPRLKAIPPAKTKPLPKIIPQKKFSDLFKE